MEKLYINPEYWRSRHPERKGAEMIITAKSHPAVLAAIIAIDYSVGAVNRYEPERETCDVPCPFDSLLDESEKWLATLTPDDLEEFCTGERFEIEEAYLSNAGFVAADKLLDAYFEDWPDATQAQEPTDA